MKHIIVALFPLFMSVYSNGQTKRLKKPIATIGIAGKYEYGKNIEKGRIGLVYIYAKTDSTIMFYLDLNRGAPSYNMGATWGEVVIKKRRGIFISSLEGAKKGCNFSFQFKADILVIETINDKDDCGFGYGVIADGTFKKISRRNPLYFIDKTGEKLYFKDLTP